ncbi:ribonuclease P protein component [Thalassiella azotivora]
MLPAAHRMRRSADFSAAVRRGARAGRPRLVVHLTSPAGAAEGTTTAGFVVSKAVGGAVVRNRVKRRLRHLVGTRLDAVPTGSRLVVRALPASSGASSGELAADLDAALARAQRSARTQPAAGRRPS